MLLLFFLTYTIPFDSPITDYLEYLQIKKFIDLPSMKPYEMEWIIPQIDELLLSETEFSAVDKKIISHFNPFLTKNMDFSSLLHLKGEYQKVPDLYYGFLDCRLGGQLTKSIGYSQALRIRIGSEIDSLGPRRWKKFQIFLNEGLIKFASERIKFDIGRRNFLLGPGDENSVLLSLAPQGYDGFLLYIPARYYEFYNIFAVLDVKEQRYISIHRIGLNLKRFLKLGFTEAILYGQSLEPLYLNFFLPYYLAQWSLNRDDNVMWCFDVQLALFNSIFYGEFLIDDYMYEDDPYPDKLAYKLGFKSLLLDKFLVRLNYTFVDKWVYTHEDYINTYEYNDNPLGFPLGNDVDKLSFSVAFMNKYGLYPRLAINYTRKGEGSIFLPFEDEGGTWTPPFPSGTVEKKLEIKAGFDYVLRYNFYIRADFGKEYWYNHNHVSGDDRDEFLFNISLWMVM